MASTNHLQVGQEPELFPHATGLLTAKQVAEALAISEKTVYAYVARGLIPYVKIQSNVRFRPQAIREWLQAKEYDVHGAGKESRRRRGTWD